MFTSSSHYKMCSSGNSSLEKWDAEKKGKLTKNKDIKRNQGLGTDTVLVLKPLWGKKTRGEKLGNSVIRIQQRIQQQNNFLVPTKLGFRAKSYRIDKVQNIRRLMGVWDLGGLTKTLIIR